MKTVIIVQARMTSTRLPGKILLEVMDKPLLEYQVERLRRVKMADEIIIATTVNETDMPVVDFCKRLRMPYFRGSENDVLSRYYYAAKQYQADIVVRITSDCPVIDPVIVQEIITFFIANRNHYDYVSNGLEESYPRGMDTEVFYIRTLEEAYAKATEQAEREHVTPFIYRHPERYRLFNYKNTCDQSHYRWTVDTIEDFTLIRYILETLYPINPQFSMQDIIELLDKHPEWMEINAVVRQKEIAFVKEK